MGVRVFEAFADFRSHLQLAAQAHPLGVRHPRRQVLPREVLHGEVRLALVLSEVVDRDDVLVRQLAGSPGLAKEALARFRVGVNRHRDDLDGDDPLEQRVEGAVDDSHAALSELLEELVATDGRHGWCARMSELAKPGEKGPIGCEMRMIAAANTAHKRVP